jgi:hypothetical protein
LFSFEEELQLLGIHLFAFAAEELSLEFFELPLGILAAAAFFEEETPSFLERALK